MKSTANINVGARPLLQSPAYLFFNTTPAVQHPCSQTINMAGDDRPKAPRIPAWQQQQEAPNSAAQQPIPSPASSDAHQEPTVVHESSASPKQAEDAPSTQSSPSFSKDEVRTFLLDPGVRDAPDDKKRSFLEAKGVSKQVVDEILLEQSAQADTNAQQQEQHIRSSFNPTEFSAQTARPVRDTPPIVTYPEFLVKPQKPPPLITIERLLNTAYAATTLAAVFYGASKYVIEPMIQNLTEARHDFAVHAHERVEGLNEKLSTLVTRDPTPSRPALLTGPAETESVTSDPTELFYTDVGVQTSPPHSRRSSTSSSDSLRPRLNVPEQHASRLSSLRTHLSTLLEAETDVAETNSALDGSLSGLRDYLTGMIYAPPVQPTDFAIWTPASGPVGGGGQDNKRKESDAIAKLRDEIRGVKGVLLSARRFPARAGGTRVG